MWYSHDNHHSPKEGSYNLLSFPDDKVILFFEPEFTYVAS